jgi:hypothetical protein
MLPQPLYQPADLRPAYQLRYSWTGWPSTPPFPIDLVARVLPDIAPEWETDGLRVLESSFASEQLQLTLSALPQVSPVALAARVKGRICDASASGTVLRLTGDLVQRPREAAGVA